LKQFSFFHDCISLCESHKQVLRHDFEVIALVFFGSPSLCDLHGEVDTHHDPLHMGNWERSLRISAATEDRCFIG
jgi:hypothetical protein